MWEENHAMTSMRQSQREMRGRVKNIQRSVIRVTVKANTVFLKRDRVEACKQWMKEAPDLNPGAPQQKQNMNFVWYLRDMWWNRLGGCNGCKSLLKDSARNRIKATLRSRRTTIVRKQVSAVISRSEVIFNNAVSLLWTDTRLELFIEITLSRGF